MHTRRSFLRTISHTLAAGALCLSMPRGVIASAIRRGAYLERTVFAMGTTVSISAFGEARDQLLEATSSAFEELHRLERLLSVYRPDSDISRLNLAAGQEPITVDPDTWNVVSRAKRYHQISRGAFDITVEPLLERSGFRTDAEGYRHGIEPLTIGDAHLHALEDHSVWLDQPGVRIDTGGIGVGYAVDRMTEILRGYDVQSALVNHSGDLFGMGKPDDSEGWEVVIPHPTEINADLLRMTIVDRAISTSTNASNTRRVGANTIGHIFDPKTGNNPSTCHSMTVLAGTSCEADAMSTASFVSGNTAMVSEAGRDYIALRPGERMETSLR